MHVNVPGDLPEGQDMEMEDNDIDDTDPVWPAIMCVCLCHLIQSLKVKKI
jgi:hypothetical protein